MIQRKYFGTDGIRGKVGQHPITPEFVLKLGWAAGRVLSKQGSRTVLIGKDTRISNYMLESALEAGLAAAGLRAALMGPMPTPAVAYLTRTFRAEAGIVLSASHNPYDDNGIKFFSAEGNKLDDRLEAEIEQEMEKPLVCVDNTRLGKATRITDAAGRYIEFCKSTFPHHLSLQGVKIVVDCANGATYHIAPLVFSELGADVTVIGATPNGININDAVGATDVAALRQQVMSVQADLGIAFDGDGDRVMMIDAAGEVVDGDQLLFIIAQEALRQGQLGGGVVGTQMTNLGLELALKELDVPFLRSKVGDRYVLEMLNEHGWRFGGEGSGHILCLDRTTTGDGIVSALQVLAAMLNAGQTLAEIKRGMQKFPQVLNNVRYQEGSADPLQAPLVQQVVADVEQELGPQGRVLLRKSGTEPLVRVMVEGQHAEQVEQYAQRIADIVAKVANQ